jgi:Asp-tRNA(Asn)/Glu-tRNA(Gln) amidotransferase C subunit
VQADDLGSYVDAIASLHRLRLDDARRAEVIAQLERIRTLAALVLDFPLEDPIEPAPRFEP